MKIKKSDLINMIQEQNDVIAKLVHQVNCHHRDIVRLESIIEPEPQLKQLDQSVFDGQDSKWQWAATDKNGEVWVYCEEPKVDKGDNRWSPSNKTPKKVGEGCDATEWKDSLIERDDIAKELAEVDLSSELTGSDLCRAMLARGDKCVLIRMGGRDDKQARDIGRFAIATSIDESGRFNVMSDQQPISKVDFAVPINNQGEPLTASEVGL